MLHVREVFHELHPRVALVVFDLAGTTIEDDDAVSHALRDALASASIEAEHDEINAVMGLAKTDAIARVVAARTGSAADERLVARIHERFIVAMRAHYARTDAVRPVPHAAATFDALHDAGVRVAIDTGFPRSVAAEAIERTRWLDDGRVDTLVTSDDVARGRPHPDMIFEAMRRVGVDDLGGVAKVGDTPSDLAEGRCAECRWTIGVTYGTHTRSELSRVPHDALVDDLPSILPLLGLASRRSPSRAGRAAASPLRPRDR